VARALVLLVGAQVLERLAALPVAVVSFVAGAAVEKQKMQDANRGNPVAK